MGGLDAVIAPIGGGMVSGSCLALSNIAPRTKIYAAEPKNADDAYRSFKAGRIIADDAPPTVVDGLKVPLKDLTWHFVSNHVSLSCDEQDISVTIHRGHLAIRISGHRRSMHLRRGPKR